MIEIYGSPRSSAGRCYWCLMEIGIPFERIPLNMKEKEHKMPEYLKLNPNGKVPVLVDDDFTLWESLAINFYLAEKYKPELLGQGFASRGLVQQWTLWSNLELQPPFIEVFIQKFFVPEEHRSQDVIDKALHKLPPLFNILNQALVEKPYLVGPEFTLADLNVASVATIAAMLRFDLTPYQEVNRWLTNITQRPSYQQWQEMPN